MPLTPGDPLEQNRNPLTKEQLLELYPQLEPATIKLMFDRGLTAYTGQLPEGSGGQYNPIDNTLLLPPSSDIGSVGHEIFHAANALAPELFPDIPQSELSKNFRASKNLREGTAKLGERQGTFDFGQGIDNLAGGAQQLLGALQQNFGGREGTEDLAFQLAGSVESARGVDRSKFGPLFVNGEVPAAGTYQLSDERQAFSGNRSTGTNLVTVPPASSVSGNRAAGQSQRAAAQKRRNKPRVPALGPRSGRRSPYQI